MCIMCLFFLSSGFCMFFVGDSYLRISTLFVFEKEKKKGDRGGVLLLDVFS